MELDSVISPTREARAVSVSVSNPKSPTSSPNPFLSENSNDQNHVESGLFQYSPPSDSNGPEQDISTPSNHNAPAPKPPSMHSRVYSGQLEKVYDRSLLVRIQLMDSAITVPKKFLNYRAFSRCREAKPDETIFLDVFEEEMKLFLHWSRYGRVPIMNAAQADSLMCFASERGIQELCLEIIGSKDKRAMNRDEREWFDVETIKQMELSLKDVVLSSQPSKPGREGEGTNASDLSAITYRGFTALLDQLSWDIPIGEKKLVSLDFLFPLHQRPFAFSIESDDARREQLGQPGFDSNLSSSTGRCCVWNCYRADPSRQIWHRVFFDSIAKRLYRDGFVFKEWFDPVSSKVHYLLSH